MTSLTLYIVLANSIEFEQLNAGGAEPLKKGISKNSFFVKQLKVKFVFSNPSKIFVKEFIFSKILRLFYYPWLYTSPVFFKEFDHRFQNTQFYKTSISGCFQNLQMPHFFYEIGTCMLKLVCAFLPQCTFYRPKSKNRVHV